MGRAWGGRRAVMLSRLTIATYGDRCHLCGTPGATTADHLIPRSRGGGDDLANLRPAHLGCNSSRRDESVAAWRARTGIGVEGSANVIGRKW